MIEALKSIPSDLVSAYEEVFYRIAANVDGQQFALRVLSWSFHAARPLLMSELREALVVDPGDSFLHMEYFHDPASIVEECKGLIFHDEKTDLVGFVHYSVRDFLGSAKLPVLLRRSDLARTLLTYLSFDVFNSGACFVKKDMERRLESHKLALHAAKFWCSYVKGDIERNTEVQDMVFHLFGSHPRVESLLELYGLHYEYKIANAQTPNPGLVVVGASAFSVETSLLHFAARYGFQTICEKIVSGSHLGSQPRPPLRRKTLVENIGERGRARNNDDNHEDIGSVNSRNGFGHIPLHLAAWEGYENIVQLLLDANANVDACSESCDSERTYASLHLASWRGHIGVVRLLLQKSADVTAVTLPDEETSLHIAARCGYLEIISVLLAAGADINALNVRRSTPVHRAVLCKDMGVLRMLIDHGPNLNIRDSRGFTPLHLAVYRINVDATVILLEAHADLMALDDLGYTVLHVAAKATQGRLDWEASDDNSLKEIVKALLRFGASVRAEDSGETPFLAALLAGNVDVVEILLEAAASGHRFKAKDKQLIEFIQRRPAAITLETVIRHFSTGSSAQPELAAHVEYYTEGLELYHNLPEEEEYPEEYEVEEEDYWDYLPSL